MVGSAVVIIALIAIGVGVGVAVSHHHSSNTQNDASTGGGKSNNPAPSSTVVPQTNPNDPSTFVKDSRLKQSFYGIAYTPEGAVYPNCTSSLSTFISLLTVFFFFFFFRA